MKHTYCNRCNKVYEEAFDVYYVCRYCGTPVCQNCVMKIVTGETKTLRPWCNVDGQRELVTLAYYNTKLKEEIIRDYGSWSNYEQRVLVPLGFVSYDKKTNNA